MARSRRTVKIPVKFGDMICGLNKKKNDQQNTRNLEETDQSKSLIDEEEISDKGYEESPTLNEVFPNAKGHNPKLKGISERLDSDNDVNNSELNLNMIPTVMNEGRDVVFFEDELVMEGSKKWELTLYGYFVGYKMAYFRDEIGLNHMLESVPWMVRSKPLLVQRWEHSLIIDKKEPNVLLVWIKLMNLPLEAWTMKVGWDMQEF
ncbi:RNA-directed DNA polymerase, eukaryota, reverse transcriptase zinc-binding domain protein [Tanacetum coccineum]